ncbi:Serine/threonine protein kinase [Pseudomonas pohangensis]|uniref:Serine/threonine protein kinase n=1 Tax=Pseudomonas pohangensis TaxID=364197 RepID=A0A1H2G0A8_9PSED|nr:serine/threonine-protein kinase [Pseudomonas pohangensis]SDU13019.1 Serine/threonine protein kinase [Pseudomonas pohangensis]
MTENLIEIPGYTVHGRLGKGGMAEVYLATQQSLQRKVAVKVLLDSGDQDFNTRFIQEGHIVASLHNPSIITIFDINRLADGRYYMAMEFVPGGDLAQHKGEVFEPQRALAIVRQIAGALAVVHAKGLIHRDIKPANILFRNDGTAVLTDFGIAKDTQIDSELTHFGVAVGSPAYSSPEQTQCQRLDARSDIYSLGLILLEMLIGHNSYRGSNYTQTVLNQVQMPVPVLPPRLAMFQSLLERMLTKDPAQRMPDCNALLAALAQIEPGDSDATQIQPAVLVAAVPGVGVTADPAPAAQRPATTKRPLRRLMWVLLWGLLLVLGVAVGGLYLKQQLQVRQLLGDAEQRLQAGQLVEPQQDSADYYFQQVLQLDAGNARALEGLQRVQNQRIANFIGSAESAIQEQRLLLPEDDSAVFYFRQVLLLEPDNARAQTGLQQIAELYRDKAKQAYQRLAFPVALEMIDAGLQVQPDNPELLQMRREHLQLKASTKAAVTDSRKRQAAQQKAAAPAPKAEESLLDKVTNGWNSIWGN